MNASVESLNQLRSGRTLISFLVYCIAHPEERFWQALRNWCGANFVAVSMRGNTWTDTFYWEGRDDDKA